MKNMIDKLVENWVPPALPSDLVMGDMPGDRIVISEAHQKSADAVFPALTKKIQELAKTQDKIVLSVSGGSGAGKSGVAALLSYYFNEAGIGCYNLSGDNYPHRFPELNDGERFRIFKDHALGYLLKNNRYQKEAVSYLNGFLEKTKSEVEAHPNLTPELLPALQSGKEGLKSYLGTENELDFKALSETVAQFKRGAKSLFLKRMGRSLKDLWYEEVDVSAIQILIVEWTHGNNPALEGIDIPIYLQSTPAETLQSRIERNRDQNADTALISLVLEIEQELLHSQVPRASLIVSRSGKLIDHAEYYRLMEAGEGEWQHVS